MSYDEHLLHYLWKYRLYPPDSLVTTDSRPVEVIDTGLLNRDAGPDFFNAKIKIGEQMWAGDVEIHRSSDDWVRHCHHKNKSYNSVILHLAEDVNCEVINQAGQIVPQCQVPVPESFRDNASFLVANDSNLPCGERIYAIPKIKVSNFLSRLATERLERKTGYVRTLLERFNNSWDEVFYVMLARNFGFGVNADAFERLALSLPYKHILKEGENIINVEALLFGQAGFLDQNVGNDIYYDMLRDEYVFLKKKYLLKGLEGHIFKRLRVRPRSFPEIRIAQFASLLSYSGRLFSVMLEETDYYRLTKWLQSEPSEYWKTHYGFGKISKPSSKKIGGGSLDVIIINTIVPLLFAYGKSISDDSYMERALDLLTMIKPEKNAIVDEFAKAGIVAENAGDSQALIQLRKEYCEKHECLFCQIGHALLATTQIM